MAEYGKHTISGMFAAILKSNKSQNGQFAKYILSLMIFCTKRFKSYENRLM